MKLLTRTNIILGSIVIFTALIGIGQILEDYQYNSVTGKAVGEGFNIEQVDQRVNPIATAFLKTNEHNLIENALDQVQAKDEMQAKIKPTMIPGRIEDHYLYIDFDEKVVIISLYMKKEGNGEGTFEIWGLNRKVAEGALSNEFRWYNFDVSFKDMSSDKYAIYNYGGGDATIVIDQIYGVPQPRSGLSEHLTGLAYN